MSLLKLNKSLVKEMQELNVQGYAKPKERIITAYRPAKGKKGPRYGIKGERKEFIRINANNYLNLSTHPKLIAAADKASKEFGVGPGAVRFIDGTFKQHKIVEAKIADFTHQSSACIFNSAYTANLALIRTLSSEKTYWISDELNHNSIINGMRMANVPKTHRTIYKHNDLVSLKDCLENIPKKIERVCIIFDGVFSMRGDHAPLAEIQNLADQYTNKFKAGVITIVDDSHGIGAYGATGRGTMEVTDTVADIIVGTFGKAFGVNGGFVASSKEVTHALRQKADTYIYTNPLGVADCGAISASLKIIDSSEGKSLLKRLSSNTQYFRKEIEAIGYTTLAGIHPIVPLMVWDGPKTKKMITALYKKGILAVGLSYPVVPKGQETIRVQLNAGLTLEDLNYILDCFQEIKEKR